MPIGTSRIPALGTLLLKRLSRAAVQGKTVSSSVTRLQHHSSVHLEESLACRVWYRQRYKGISTASQTADNLRRLSSQAQRRTCGWKDLQYARGQVHWWPVWSPGQ